MEYLALTAKYSTVNVLGIGNTRVVESLGAFIALAVAGYHTLKLANIWHAADAMDLNSCYSVRHK